MRPMKTALALCFFTFLGAAASRAQPVYLTCTVKQIGGDIARIDFSLDESTRNVTLTFAHSGSTRTTTGLFTAKQVSVVLNRGEVGEMVLTIDRVSLAFHRTIPAINSTRTGTCTVTPPPKNRKF
jgi:hypothetical protein